MRLFGDNSQPICLARQTRGCDCSSHHSLERKGQQQWPLRAQDRSEPLAWALLTHRSVLDPSTETAWKREMLFGIPYSPASPSWLSQFPTSSSLSILCFWYHYQTVKHSVRTFLSSKVQFPPSTVQICPFSSWPKVPWGVWSWRMPNLSLSPTALGNILHPFKWVQNLVKPTPQNKEWLKKKY